MAGKNQIVATDVVEKHILLIRGQKVMLDTDLAAPIRCADKAVEPASAAESEAISGRFHVRAHRGGG